MPAHAGPAAGELGRAFSELTAAAHAVASEAQPSSAVRVEALVEAARKYHLASRVPDTQWVLLTVPDDVGRLASTAHHEAGHVVVGFLIGCKVIGATTIGPSGGKSCLGNVHFVKGRQRAEREAILCYAGAAAEVRYRPQMWPATGYEDDYHRAEEKLILSGVECEGPEWTALIARLQRRAAVLVDASWPTIEAVAASIIPRGRVEAAELVALIEATLPPNMLAISKKRGAGLPPTVAR